MKIKIKLFMGFFFIGILSIILGIVSYYNAEQMATDFTFLIEHDLNVLQNAQKLQKLIVDAETGQRGFIITGDEEFLQLYNIGINEFGRIMEIEKKLVSDNPSQVEKLESIEKLFHSWKVGTALPEIEMAREIHRTDADFQPMEEHLSLGVGKSLLDNIRQEFAEFIQIENDLKDQRFQKTLELEFQVKILTVVISIIIVSSALIIGFLLYRTISLPLSKLKVGSEELSKGGHIKLEISGNDEISELTHSFNTMAKNILQSKMNNITNMEVLQKQKNKLDETNLQLEEANKKIKTQIQESFQRYTLQSQLLTSNAELVSEKKFGMEKDEFAAMVSHELKTPIFPIKMHCEMLKDPKMLGKLTPEQLDSVNQIESMAIKLEELTRDILDAQKLDMKKMKFSKTKFKLGDFFNEIEDQSRINLIDKNISLTFDIKDLELTTDHSRLNQIITNLIQNAIVFVTPKTGKIKVKVKVKNGDILFSVKDNGIGISPDRIPHLFRKFYQIDASLKRRHDGTGLGLVICKGLVEGLGGKIWLESKLKKGTTFYFTIPIKEKIYNYITGVRNPALENYDKTN